MNYVQAVRRTGSHIVMILLILCFPAVSHAQFGGGQQGGGGFGGGGFGNNGGGGGGGGGFGGGGFGGIAISPEGIVSSTTAQKINLRLEQKRLKELAGRELSTQITKASALRKISLRRLDEILHQRVEQKATIEPEISFLAGLTRVEYVFVDKEGGDIILAGPAEAFAPMKGGRVVSVETGRPTLVLEDLLTMMRLKSIHQTLGCSFDPDQQRLAKVQAFNASNRGPAASVAAVRQNFATIAQILGNWDVSVFGIPDSSHTALTTVDADYHLKRVTLGKQQIRIRGFRSLVDMMKPGDNMMRRWWFAPRYNPIERSPAGDAFRLSGPRLQLLSQEELVNADGERSDAAFKDLSTEAYTKQFNKHIEALCQQVPSFAATQNLFDLAVVAAIVQKYELAKQVDWQPKVLTQDSKLPLPKYEVPTAVGSQMNMKMTGRSLVMGLVGGGVTIAPANLITRVGELPQDKVPAFKTKEPEAWWWD